MNVRWYAPSGGGYSVGRVSGVVNVATHDVHPGCTGLMAGLARGACSAGVANLDLVSVHPAVPNLVPSRFGIAQVRGANMSFRQWGGSCWCRRGWDTSGTHSCDEELDVDDGFGERCVGGHQVFDGDVLLNCCVS